MGYEPNKRAVSAITSAITVTAIIAGLFMVPEGRPQQISPMLPQLAFAGIVQLVSASPSNL